LAEIYPLIYGNQFRKNGGEKLNLQDVPCSVKAGRFSAISEKIAISQLLD
jgi:hypothetical protein